MLAILLLTFAATAPPEDPGNGSAADKAAAADIDTPDATASEADPAEEGAADTAAAVPAFQWPPEPTLVDKLMGSDRYLRAARMAAGPDADPYPVDSNEWLEADPLLILDSEMASASRDLSGGRLDRPHEVTQPRIVARLDRLIALLEAKKRSGNGPANGGQPAMDSTLSPGGAEAGDLRAADDKARGMQQLPDAQRDRIRQAREDGFPPGFEDVLSDYYKRLAEADE